MSGLVFDYDNINAKLKGIDKDKEDLDRTVNAFYEVTKLVLYKLTGAVYCDFKDQSETNQQMYKDITIDLIKHGYNP